MMEFKKDYFVVAFDMRGYNLSEKPKHRLDYRIEELVNDVEDVIKHFNKEKCILVGHDWGGAVSWSFADKKSQYLEKLIMINSPHPKAMIHAVRTNPEQVKRSWYIFAFQLPFYPEYIFKKVPKEALYAMGNKDAVTTTDMSREHSTFQLTGALTAAINYYRNMFNGTKAIGNTKISVPTLALWGKQDNFLTLDVVSNLEKYVEKIEIQYFDKGSHWLQQDEAQGVNKAMREYLQK